MLIRKSTINDLPSILKLIQDGRQKNHSWERGANENTNGLIRQYIPKGTDFSEITDEFVSWVENKLNNRPRKRLGYLTPNEKFNSILTN